MSTQLPKLLATETVKLEQAGLLRRELVSSAAEGGRVGVAGRELVSFVGDDYLGLSTHEALRRAARDAIDAHGLGSGTPRMATGTLALHQKLEEALSRFLGTESTLVLASGYHAATGAFESVLGERDYVFTDEQIDPALADGVRLSRAKIFSYRTGDLEHLEDRLRRSRGARFRVVVTDGVLPLDGALARLPELVKLTTRYDALLVLGDAHGTGVLGAGGRGTAEHLGVAGQVDVVVGSLAHALGAGTGGFVSGRKAVVEWLRQKSRPYLVSPALPPASAAAALRSLELVQGMGPDRKSLLDRAETFRRELARAGLTPLGAVHPIVPVLVRDAVATQRLADAMHRRGYFVMGFCHPVVPEGQARLRLQITLRHGPDVVRAAAAALVESARELRLVENPGPAAVSTPVAQAPAAGPKPAEPATHGRRSGRRS